MLRDYTMYCVKHNYYWYTKPEKPAPCYNCAQERVVAALQALRDALDEHPWAREGDGVGLSKHPTMVKFKRPLKMLENLVARMPEPGQVVVDVVKGIVAR